MSSGPDRTGGALCVAGAVAAYFAWRAGAQAAALLSVRRVSKLSELDGDASLPQLVAVRGAVCCDDPLRVMLPGEADPLLCVLHETVVKRLVAVRGVFDDAWTTRSRVVARTLRQAPFGLDDGSARIWLLTAATAQGLRLATVHRAVLEPEPVPFWRALLDAVVAVLRGVVPLHTTVKQKALPVGARLTAVGLACRGVDGHLVLRRPPRGGPFYASPDEVEELAAELLSRRTTLLWWAGAGVLAGTALMAYRARARLREAHAADAAAREEAERLATLEAEEAEAADVSEADACTVCLSRRRSHVFPACGHLACCAACSLKLAACPICRAPGRARKLFR